MPHQIIDYTHGRNATFFDGVDLPVKHIDFTEPYCPKLRDKWQQAAIAIGEPLIWKFKENLALTGVRRSCTFRFVGLKFLSFTIKAL